jgi:MATE family multidrug resistance protein
MKEKPPGPTIADEAKSTLRLAGPMVLANIAPNLMSAIALASLGQVDGTVLGSGALMFGLFTLCITVAGGLDAATMAFASNALGARVGATSRLLSLIRHAVVASLTFSIVLVVLLQWTETFFLELGQDPLVAGLAGEHMKLLCVALVPFGLAQALRSALNARDKVGQIVFVSLAAIAVQLGLCFVAINIPPDRLSPLSGVSLATLASSLVLLAGMAWLFLVDGILGRLNVVSRRWRFDLSEHARFWRVGGPVVVTLCFEAGLFYAALLLIGRFSVTQLAAHSIAVQVVAMFFKIPFAIGQASTIRIARAMGRATVGPAVRAGWVGFGLAMASATVTSTIMLTQPFWLASLFLNIASPGASDILAEAGILLMCAGMFQFSDAAQAVGAGMLRGLRDVTVPMVMAGAGYWAVGLPSGVAIAKLWNLEALGVWLGLTAGLTTVAIGMIWRWSVLTRRLRRTGVIVTTRSAISLQH